MQNIYKQQKNTYFRGKIYTIKMKENNIFLGFLKHFIIILFIKALKQHVFFRYLSF